MTELLDAMAGPQASGGVLDFYDMRITYPTDNVTSFNISVFTSGYEENSKPSVTLNSTDINTEDTAGGFEEPRGLLINSWGASGAGSLTYQLVKIFIKTNYNANESRNSESVSRVGY